MKKFVKPACLAFYVLSLLVFFLIGLFYAGWIEAGKHQGLAGGAIVLGWGVLFGTIALVIALFIGFRLKKSVLLKLNWTFLLMLLIALATAYFKYKSEAKNPSENASNVPTKTTNATPD